MSPPAQAAPGTSFAEVMVVAARNAVERQAAVARAAELPGSAGLAGVYDDHDANRPNAAAGLTGDFAGPRPCEGFAVVPREHGRRPHRRSRVTSRCHGSADEQRRDHDRRQARRRCSGELHVACIGRQPPPHVTPTGEPSAPTPAHYCVLYGRRARFAKTFSRAEWTPTESAPVSTAVSPRADTSTRGG